MKIVIDIPEELFNIAKDGMLNEIQSMFICGSVSQGTPLPKGHGDLIDRKELLRQPMDVANYPSNYVRIAPTIIEADTGRSGEK